MLHHWQPNAPESWARLSELAGSIAESELPGELWRHLEFLPYLCLLLPYRLTAASAKGFDYVAQDRAAQELVTVSLDVSEPGEVSGINSEGREKHDSA